jgi:PhnB protein
MTNDGSVTYGKLTPYLYYEDVPAALDWLARAFGFRERLRMTNDDGTVGHAEMEFGEAVVMMGRPGPDYRNPKRLGQATASLYLQVDDVDKHFAQAREAGATVLREPRDQDYGDRNYGVTDPEGHEWWFGQPAGGKEPGAPPA